MRHAPAQENIPAFSVCFIYLSLLIPDPPVELLPLEAQEVLPGVDDATFDGDGTRSVDVVPGDHAHGDPGSLALPDGFWHLQTTPQQFRFCIFSTGFYIFQILCSICA